MLSEQGQALLFRNSYKNYKYEQGVVDRPRLCSDDVRVLFRSMAIPRSEDSADIDAQQRMDDDDRDLIDVMVSIMDWQGDTKWGYWRDELLAVANTFPSSMSQATEGLMLREEICALLNLLKASKPVKDSSRTNEDPDIIPYWRYMCNCVDEEWGSWMVDRGANDVSRHSLEELIHALQQSEVQSTPLLWEPFCQLFLETYVGFSYTGLYFEEILTLNQDPVHGSPMQLR